MTTPNHLLRWHCRGITSDSARLGFLEFRRDSDGPVFGIVLDLTPDHSIGAQIDLEHRRTGHWCYAVRRDYSAVSAGYFHFLRIFTLACKWRTWVSASRLWELEQETPKEVV
jgi:hypothetical protein